MYKLCKRAFDIFFSIFIIIFLSPIFLIIIISILLFSPGKVIYKQNRVGKDGKIFKMYKFRTMVNNADKILDELLNSNKEAKKEYENFAKLKNDPRIIPVVGKFLRKYSLDEFPQFFNVLRGDMSIVGPRPVSEYEFNTFYIDHKDIFSLKPGITGLWQVSGRNDLSYNQRINLDLEYLNNRSIFLDFKIILKTIKVMLYPTGAY